MLDYGLHKAVSVAPFVEILEEILKDYGSTIDLHRHTVLLKELYNSVIMGNQRCRAVEASLKNCPPDELQDLLNMDLTEAAQHGDTRMISFLIARGASADHTDDTPLKVAAESGRVSAVSLLIQEAGAGMKGCGKEEALAAALRKGHIQVVHTLIQLGTSPSYYYIWQRNTNRI